jgi:tetratricopeptide (TPR) repeat protein
MGRLDDAIEAFRVSVGINPHYVAAWINLAFAAAEHDEIEEAREALEQVLALEPDNAPAQVLAEKLGRKSRKRPPLRGTVA